MTWEPTQTELDQFLATSRATYDRTVPAGWTPFGAGQAIDLDGFYGAAYQKGSQLIIAFEGSWWQPFPAYLIGSLGADVTILAGNLPAAAQDAISWGSSIIGAWELEGYSTSNIYLTGHSLGGAEAEALAQYEYNLPANISLAGATFGAPGLPENTVPGQDPNLIDYVDYGDPVGNYASDPASPTSGDDLVPADAYHYGTETFVGNTTDTSSSEISGIAALVDSASGNPLSAVEAANAVFGLQYHTLENYQTDVANLGSSVTGSAPAVTLSGSVSVNFGSSRDSDGNTTYTFANVSANLTADAPLISLSSNPSNELEYWSDPSTWGGFIIPTIDSVQWTDVIAGIIESPFLSLLNIPQYVNTLAQSGPSRLPSFLSVQVLCRFASIAYQIGEFCGMSLRHGHRIVGTAG